MIDDTYGCTWQGFNRGRGGSAGWPLEEVGFLTWSAVRPSSCKGPPAGQSWAHQWSSWGLWENIFKKGQTPVGRGRRWRGRVRNNRGKTEMREGGGESAPGAGADIPCSPWRTHAGGDFLQDYSLWRTRARGGEATKRNRCALTITSPSSLLCHLGWGQSLEQRNEAEPGRVAEKVFL